MGNLVRDTKERYNSPFMKFLLLVQTVRNWPLLAVDKLGLQKEITYNLSSGYKVLCRGKSSDINEVMAVMTGLEYPKRFFKLNKDDVWFDLGANIGSFSLYLHSQFRHIKTKGYIFEPFAENLKLLKNNISINKIKNVEIVQEAVGGKNGIVFLDTDVPPDGVKISSEKTGVKVSVTKLSSFCKKKKITSVSLVKMDIEGAEKEVFENDFTFFANNVAQLILEYHSWAGCDLKWVRKTLKKDFDISVVYSNEWYGVIYAKNKKFNLD